MATAGTIYTGSSLSGTVTSPFVRTFDKTGRTHIPISVFISGTVTAVELLGKVNESDTPVVIQSFTSTTGVIAAMFPLMGVRVTGASAATVRVTAGAVILPLWPETFATITIPVSSSSAVVPLSVALSGVTQGESFVAGASKTLTAAAAGTNAGSATFSWSGGVSGSGASKSLSGLVAGTYTVTVTASNAAGETATASLTFTVTAAAATVSGVTVSPASPSISVGGTTTLTATVAGTNNPSQGVTWASSNTAVATVNASGVVTAVAAGTATITATSTLDTSKSGSATATVTSAAATVSGVTVSPTTATGAAGTTQQYTATVAGTNSPSQAVTWASSNTAIATVNSSGLVTRVAAGTATITATSVADTSKSGSATDTVNAVSSGFVTEFDGETVGAVPVGFSAMPYTSGSAGSPPLRVADSASEGKVLRTVAQGGSQHIGLAHTATGDVLGSNQRVEAYQSSSAVSTPAYVGLMARASGTSDATRSLYYAAFARNSAGTLDVRIVKVKDGTAGTLVDTGSTSSWVTGVFNAMRFDVSNDANPVLTVKAWDRAAGEASAVTISITDSTNPLGAGKCGLYTAVNEGTNLVSRYGINLAGLAA